MSENHNENTSHDHNPTNKNPTFKEINEILDKDGKYAIGHGMNGHGNKLESIRKDEYKGHKIIISYNI